MQTALDPVSDSNEFCSGVASDDPLGTASASNSHAKKGKARLQESSLQLPRSPWSSSDETDSSSSSSDSDTSSDTTLDRERDLNQDSNSAKADDQEVYADASGSQTSFAKHQDDHLRNSSATSKSFQSRSRPRPSRGILREPRTASSSDPLWIGKELVYSLNSRLAQQNLPALSVRMPTGGAISMISGVFRKLSQSSVNEAQNLDEVGTESSAASLTAVQKPQVHFRVEDMSHTYLIHNTEAPMEEQATRQRVEKEYDRKTQQLRQGPWTSVQLQKLYRICCRAREELPHAAVLAALQQANSWTDARTLDLTSIDLQRTAQPLADMLGAPIGLTRLVLEDCNLSDDGAQALMHALSISHSVRILCMAHNPMIRSLGWDALGHLVSLGHIENLDLSENALSKSALKSILAFAMHLQTLRMEQCGLRPASLEIIANTVRTSRIRHLSLRRNRLSAPSIGNLALLLRDIHDRAQPYVEAAELQWHRIREFTHELYGTTDASVTRALLHGTRIERSAKHEERRLALQRTALSYCAKLCRLPHCSALQTLDLKANFLRTNLAPLAAALRRNATLRVLNLSQNELDPMALVALADALRYNTTLETLDLSQNPCCGPDLVGVLRLREALGVHPKLRRVFLNGTRLTAEGAIALAECLPDAKHLLHLDLTNNAMGCVGLLALQMGATANNMIRCLDVSVDRDDSEMMQMAQKLYNTCLEHADAASHRAQSESARNNVYTPLKRSALATALQGGETQATISERPIELAHALSRAQDTLVPEGSADAQRLARAELQRAVQQAESMDESTMAESLNVLDQLSEALQTSEAILLMDTNNVSKDSTSSDTTQRADGLLSEEGKVFRRAKTLEAQEYTSPATESSPVTNATLVQAENHEKEPCLTSASIGAPVEPSGDQLKQAILHDDRFVGDTS
ncbi:hypothetical protein MYAM1_003984 [Malassezia yamatoensis]|uniref:Protein phosphatase 1 regulatory subunit 37 n=1 Tax=Malassezia yamatoensis TaxID=253288 RepID=A0AAJ5YWX4_9BASI|nr:hypothetical protein MYAM1_003984 [Malassezia yamatoensis]